MALPPSLRLGGFWVFTGCFLLAEFKLYDGRWFLLALPGEAACFSMRCQFGCRVERGGSVGCTCPPGLRLAANNKTCEGKNALFASSLRLQKSNLIRSDTEQPFHRQIIQSDIMFLSGRRGRGLIHTQLGKRDFLIAFSAQKVKPPEKIRQRLCNVQSQLVL